MPHTRSPAASYIRTCRGLQRAACRHVLRLHILVPGDAVARSADGDPVHAELTHQRHMPNELLPLNPLGVSSSHELQEQSYDTELVLFLRLHVKLTLPLSPMPMVPLTIFCMTHATFLEPPLAVLPVAMPRLKLYAMVLDRFHNTFFSMELGLFLGGALALVNLLCMPLPPVVSVLVTLVMLSMLFGNFAHAAANGSACLRDVPVLRAAAADATPEQAVHPLFDAWFDLVFDASLSSECDQTVEDTAAHDDAAAGGEPVHDDAAERGEQPVLAAQPVALPILMLPRAALDPYAMHMPMLPLVVYPGTLTLPLVPTNWCAELLGLILERHGALECMMLPLPLPLLSRDANAKSLFPQPLVMTNTSGELVGTTSASNGTDRLTLPIPHNPKKLCMMLHAMFCRLEWLPLLVTPLRWSRAAQLAALAASPGPAGAARQARRRRTRAQLAQLQDAEAAGQVAARASNFDSARKFARGEVAGLLDKRRQVNSSSRQQLTLHQEFSEAQPAVGGLRDNSNRKQNKQGGLGKLMAKFEQDVVAIDDAMSEAEPRLQDLQKQALETLAKASGSASQTSGSPAWFELDPEAAKAKGDEFQKWHASLREDGQAQGHGDMPAGDHDVDVDALVSEDYVAKAAAFRRATDELRTASPEQQEACKHKIAGSSARIACALLPAGGAEPRWLNCVNVGIPTPGVDGCCTGYRSIRGIVLASGDDLDVPCVNIGNAAKEASSLAFKAELQDWRDWAQASVEHGGREVIGEPPAGVLAAWASQGWGLHWDCTSCWSTGQCTVGLRECEISWFQRPADGMLSGNLFADGSALHPADATLRRTSWAIAMARDLGRAIAAAFGPVPWGAAPLQFARRGEGNATRALPLVALGVEAAWPGCASAVGAALTRARSLSALRGQARARGRFHAAFGGSALAHMTKDLCSEADAWMVSRHFLGTPSHRIGRPLFSERLICYLACGAFAWGAVRSFSQGRLLAHYGLNGDALPFWEAQARADRVGSGACDFERSYGFPPQLRATEAWPGGGLACRAVGLRGAGSRAELACCLAAAEAAARRGPAAGRPGRRCRAAAAAPAAAAPRRCPSSPGALAGRVSALRAAGPQTACKKRPAAAAAPAPARKRPACAAPAAAGARPREAPGPQELAAAASGAPRRRPAVASAQACATPAVEGCQPEHPASQKLMAFRKRHLRAECRRRGLDDEGRKEVLVAALCWSDDAACSPGSSSTELLPQSPCGQLSVASPRPPSAPAPAPGQTPRPRCAPAPPLGQLTPPRPPSQVCRPRAAAAVVLAGALPPAAAPAGRGGPAAARAEAEDGVAGQRPRACGSCRGRSRSRSPRRVAMACNGTILSGKNKGNACHAKQARLARPPGAQFYYCPGHTRNWQRFEPAAALSGWEERLAKRAEAVSLRR
ncbi:unnamed protein product [Prorocentrum cordatum]|uniref:SAP domain-containing protein n=1 Tax=Prorocentrum cordatum TaxID=2364126 RepID=A0ABN9VK04_9DINO|nr:unnamed protein product [Polarella glacialis]